MYDSDKNWSIMIKDSHNDLRNEVMYRTKTTQNKRRLASKIRSLTVLSKE